MWTIYLLYERTAGVLCTISIRAYYIDICTSRIKPIMAYIFYHQWWLQLDHPVIATTLHRSYNQLFEGVSVNKVISYAQTNRYLT